MPIKNLDIQTVSEDDKNIQKSAKFDLIDSIGRTFRIDAKALIIIPVLKVSPGKTTLLSEAFSQFSHDSKTGFGVTEYLWTERCF